jgi:hypothetical protein
VADPTGARMRTINAFFDSPRFPVKVLPPHPEDADGPVASPSPSPVPAAPGSPAAVPTPAGPKVTLRLPAAKFRTRKALLASGLSFMVTTDKAVSDVEVRLYEVLATGLRPLGVAFRSEPAAAGATLRVEVTSFGRSKLKAGGRRKLRAVVMATGRDGTIGRAQVSFDVR